MTDKDKLKELIAGLTHDELYTLKQIISGKLGGSRSKRTITPEQHAAMIAAKMKKKLMQ